MGQVNTLLADTGYCSQANVPHCHAKQIEPLLAVRRDSHHLPMLQRFAPDAPAPESDDALVKMAHRLKTRAGRALYGLRKQTVEPVFGIIKQVMGWRQMSMRRLEKAQGEWYLVALALNIKRLHIKRENRTPKSALRLPKPRLRTHQQLGNRAITRTARIARSKICRAH